jgi:uncharacterized protein YjiS (DUF1127 family)
MEDVMSVVPLVGPLRPSGETRARSYPIAKSLGLVRHLSAWIVREVRVRRDMRRLAEFDDVMLRDIGIARADIEGAVRRGHDGSSGTCMKP